MTKVKSVQLSDLCKVDWGNTSLTKASYVDDGKYLAVSAAGCDGRIGHAEHKRHTPVLSAIGARCGMMFFPEEDFTAIKNTITLTPYDDVCDPKFLYYLLTHSKLPQRGAGQPFISKGDTERFQVRVPLDLREQRRIARTLDGIFTNIDSLQANIATQSDKIRDLLVSELDTLFAQRGRGWIERTLGEIAEIAYGYTASASDKPSAYQFLRITDLRDYGVDWNTVPYCQIAKKDAERFTLASGDIVFARTGATTGKSYLVLEPPKAVFASYLIRLRVVEDGLLPNFVHLFFGTTRYWDNIQSGLSGSAQGGFNATKLSKIKLAYPKSPDEQAAIVQKVSAISDRCQHLQTLYQRKRELLQEVKASFLHHALEGGV